MLVYGKNVLFETDTKKIKKAYICKKDYIEYLTNNRINYKKVDQRVLDNMVSSNHQGIVMEVDDYKYSSIDNIKGDFVVMLDHINDPHNFGAIIRTCACAGVSDIIIPNKRSVVVNDTVVKVSSGNIDKVNIIMTSNLVNAINYLKKQGFFVYASDMGGVNYRGVDYSDKKCLVIGNEGDGVSRLVKENSDEVISIPMNNDTESLNASVAAGILIYEMRIND